MPRRALPLILGGLVLAVVAALLLAPEPEASQTAATQRAPSPDRSPKPAPLEGEPSGDPAPGEEAPDVAEPAGPGDTRSGAATAGEGRVVGRDGAPVAGAEVLAASPEGSPVEPPLCLADREGRFSWPTPPRLLVVRARGFALCIVPPDGPRTVVLERSRGLAGQVVDGRDGSPVPGATVEGQTETWRELARTDPRGRFVLAAPSAGVTLLVAAPGFRARVLGEEALPRIPLERGRGLEGRLSLPSGGAPGPTRVWVVGGEQVTRAQPAESSPDGRFSLAGGLGDDEPVWVLAFCDGYATPLDPVWLEVHGEPLELTLAPRGGLSLTGLPADEPAPSLSPLDLPSGVEPGWERPVRRGEELSYAGLPAGSYQLLREGAPLGPALRVPPGPEPLRVDWGELVVQEAQGVRRPLRVRVTDPGGLPLAGARVFLSAQGGEASATCDASGQVELEAPPGALTVGASAPGRILVEPVVRDGDDRADVLLVLAEATTLAGQVFPAERAELRVLDPSGEELRVGWSDEGGRFRLEGLPAGDYLLEVATERKQPVRVGVRLPGAEVHVHLTEDYGTCGHDHGEAHGQ